MGQLVPWDLGIFSRCFWGLPGSGWERAAEPQIGESGLPLQTQSPWMNSVPDQV